MKIAALKKRLNAQTKISTLVVKKTDPETWGKVVWINALRNLESQIFLNFLDLKRCTTSPC